MKQRDAFKRDNLLVNFLLYKCKGKENIASAKTIADHLNECGYATNVGMIRQIIRNIIFERRLPICSLNSKGYFWANNQQELKEAMAELKGRISEMKDRVDVLQGFVIE